MFFTAGNVIVAHTPSMHPYRYPSPVKYAKELAIYMLPDQLIRRLTGITDPITKLSVLLETDYTGTWLLRDWGMDVTPTSAVGVSTIGHFWMLGGFLLMRRAMLEELRGFDEGFRLYGEDIDLQYRAGEAGWERWYVPEALVRHEHKAETDKRWLTRRTLWHWKGILRFVRKHPERLLGWGP